MLNTLSILALKQTPETAPAGPVKGIDPEETTALWADAMEADLTDEIATSLPVLVSVLPAKRQMPMTFRNDWMQIASEVEEATTEAPVIATDAAPPIDQIAEKRHINQPVTIDPVTVPTPDTDIVSTCSAPVKPVEAPTLFTPVVTTPDTPKMHGNSAPLQQQVATTSPDLPNPPTPAVAIEERTIAVPDAAILPAAILKAPTLMPQRVTAPAQQPVDRVSPVAIEVPLMPAKGDTKVTPAPVSTVDAPILQPAPATPIRAAALPDHAPISGPPPARVAQAAPLPFLPPAPDAAPIDAKPVKAPQTATNIVENQTAVATSSASLPLVKAAVEPALESPPGRLGPVQMPTETTPDAVETRAAPMQVTVAAPTTAPPLAPPSLASLNAPKGIADLPLNSIAEVLHSPVAANPNASILAQPHAPLTTAPAMVIAQVAQVTPQDRFPLEIALDPPELGRVRMQLHAQDTNVTLVIQADRPETHDLMRRHLEDLTKTLEKQGFTNISLEFSNGQNDPRNTPSHPAEGAMTDANGDTTQPADTPQGTVPTTPLRRAESGLNLIL